MPTEEGNKRREAAMAKYGQVLGEIFDDLDKDKSGFASIEEMWYVVVEKLLDNQLSRDQLSREYHVLILKS